ncbi:recombinase [Alkanindiges hydrocarboniclasticus]|uniref:Recombinase n=1 Tax=Alkanindiges hydrocarboniclasticus TaxID=1907941 RepID=A0A1S8CX12_9GAMM|nr:site-specific recombinase [Alkanindiges hydrocarboniclasticus]ONG41727.1 recombinase [Alkanindiges hydrocarboniclasticus]
MHIEFHDLFESMEAQLKQGDFTQATPETLVELVARLRPKDAYDEEEIQDRLGELIELLITKPHHATILHDYIMLTLANYQQISLYADSSLLGNESFFSELSHRIGNHFLPPLRDQTQLSDLFRLVFCHRYDPVWLDHIDLACWQELMTLIIQPYGRIDLRVQAREQVLNAMMVISYRITALSLDPEFAHAYPDLNEYESPFLIQNREILDFIQRYREYTSEENLRWPPILPDEKQALVMLDQCSDVLSRIKRGTRRSGVSLSLTNILLKMDQCLTRIELLFYLLLDDAIQVQDSLIALLRQLSKTQLDATSIRGLVSANTELLARQVTENASRTGGHYVSTDKQGFVDMYRSAAGAGMIIATMSTLKILAGRLTLAPLSQAFIYSMNYSLGFMLIHILHFTVATKQPAMTAAALAATVQQNIGNRAAQMAELAELTVNIMRTQFVAILGNISIAMPTAFIITSFWQMSTGQPLLSPQKAEYLLHNINPFTSLAIPHAAIAGVCLFLSGLIAGYYDNLAVYRKIGPRMRQQPKLNQWLGAERLDRVAGYIERNLGALAGNFWFGIMLGSVGTIGFILGLPIDIRHIAFSSANFIQGLMCVNGMPDIGLVVVSFLGVMLIGLTNLLVSFGLALFVALRARQVKYEQWRPLLRLLLTHFMTRPSDFFWPPKEDKTTASLEDKSSSHF